MKSEKNFIKTIQKENPFFIKGLFLIVISIFISIIMIICSNESPIDLKEIKKSEDYAKIDVQVMTDFFATTDYSKSIHKTYFVWDKENVYIVDLDDENKKKLDEIYRYSYSTNDIEAPKSVTIKGIAKKIPSDLKELATQSINKILGEELVNQNNFFDTFGDFYLDTYENKNAHLQSLFLISLTLFLIGLSFLMFPIIKKLKKNKK